MEYVGPPRGATKLLRLFASEPDFGTVIGDLSEEFQQQVSTCGHAAARRWYWRETFRNANALAKRELFRTPAIVLAATVFILGVLWLAEFYGVQLLRNVQWAWIPPRFWHWYQDSVVFFLFPTSMVIGAGTLASCFLKAREISAIVAFAGVLPFSDLYRLYVLIRNSIQGRGPAHISVLRVSEQMLVFWFLATVFYSLGCLWIRWHRLPGEIVGRK